MSLNVLALMATKSMFNIFYLFNISMLLNKNIFQWFRFNVTTKAHNNSIIFKSVLFDDLHSMLLQDLIYFKFK